jgi:predicted esterase
LSGYLANAAKWKISAAGVKTKLGMFHGKADPVVKLIWAQNSFDKIKNEGGIEDANIKLYDGLEHSATEEELMDVVAFLQRCIQENENAPEL